MLQNSEEIAQILKRNERSVYFRWTTQIRAWLLQYYKKSLNLEIRPMLANVLADNFESVDSIDWKIVMSFPEFSGFTESILSFIFSSKILSNASRRLGVKRSDLSLKEIAIDAEALVRPVLDKVDATVIYSQDVISGMALTNSRCTECRRK